MTLLPIVVRELRVAARRKSTYSARFRTAFAAVLGGAAIMFAVNQATLVPGMGSVVFQGLAFFGFYYCLALSANTADCISDEKREGTLGLLFLTDLSGWDVALGKLCANSLKSFYAILGTFPVVAIVLAMGGVSAGQFCRVALALLSVFFFAHAAGLLASVLSRVRSRAYFTTAALLFGFLAGPYLLAASFSSGSFASYAPLLECLSPGYAFDQVISSASSRYYWISLLMVHLTGWLFLALASWRLPHCWQENAGPARLRWRDRFRQWTYGPPAFRRRLRRDLAGINPFLWLVSRDRLSPALFRGILALLGCLWIWAWSGIGQLDPSGLIFVVVIDHLALICGVAAEASRYLEEHRRSGALEFVLCSTPLQPGEILAGQWLALRRLFLWPLVLVLASDLLVVMLNHSRYVKAPLQDRLEFDAFMAVAVIMLVVDLIATGWVGMWRAMSNRKPKQGAAVIETLFVLLFVPFLLNGLFFLTGGILADYSPAFDRWWSQGWVDSSGFALALWLVLALSFAAGSSLLARRQLTTRFREMAAVQVSERLGILGQLGRLLGRAFRRH